MKDVDLTIDRLWIVLFTDCGVLSPMGFPELKCLTFVAKTPEEAGALALLENDNPNNQYIKGRHFKIIRVVLDKEIFGKPFYEVLNEYETKDDDNHYETSTKETQP